MNLEGLTLSLLTKYLQKELLGSKIYKIFMPTPHSLLLAVRRKADTCSVLADLSGFGPIIYLPNKLPENPDTPPSFCMLLRKHLEEGRITNIYQNNSDRIITMEIDLLGAGSKIITKKLILELAGKNNNIILTQDNLIIDSLKHVNSWQNSYRTILPGKEYHLPPQQEGVNLLTTEPQKIIDKLQQSSANNILQSFIAATVGIGKVTATEILAQAAILPQQEKLQPAQAESLTAVIAALQSRLSNQENVFAVISRTNQIKTILPLKPQCFDAACTVQEFTDINQAVNYAAKLKPIQLPKHEQLQKLVAAEISKQTKKLQLLKNDLQTANNAETQKIIADTIMANIYQLAKGQESAQLYNIYDGELMTVALSPILTPVENAQQYYRRYNKYKRAQTEIEVQLQSTHELLAYLSTLEISLLTATTKNEIEEIMLEMSGAGLIKEQGKKLKSSLQKSQPLHIKLSASTDIYIGKNNRQNDYVTFSVASPKDLWLHTKDIPGSHVVFKTTLPEPDTDELKIAVQMAAYYSKARYGSNVPVDCTQKKYVKKPSGSKPGFVIFTNQKTYYTTPDEKALAKFIQ